MDTDDIHSMFGISLDEIVRLEMLNMGVLQQEITDMDFNDVLRVAYAAGPESNVGQCVKHLYKLSGVPIMKEYSLFPYQIEALTWMREREEKRFFGMVGGFLSLTMGLGKTLIGLVHILSSCARRLSCMSGCMTLRNSLVMG